MSIFRYGTSQTPVAVLLTVVNRSDNQVLVKSTRTSAFMAFSQVVSALDSLKDQAKDAIWALSSFFCQQSAKVKIYGRTYIAILFGYLTAVVQDLEGKGKIVYLFLPLCQHGNLQDANVVNGKHFPEQDMIRMFKGTCEAVRAIHDYHTTTGSTSAQPQPSLSSSSSRVEEHHSDGGDELFSQPEGDNEGGYSYDKSVNMPLMTKHRLEGDGDVIFDGNEGVSAIQPAQNGNVPQGKSEHIPYAHHDLKPVNVMIADDGVMPILIDFGSTVKARIRIDNRSQALIQQDVAAEQSTMVYCAPELFDVKTGITLDEKVDTWSHGCALFALTCSHSPFENIQTTEQGGSIAMAVLNAQYKHPNSAYSQGLKDLIDCMLGVDPKDRPNIHQSSSVAVVVHHTIHSQLGLCSFTP
ncbi:protein kinase [Suillus lakei]|nr:protein kinase [Suillus lakei]